jgi:hypothetical protein
MGICPSLGLKIAYFTYEEVRPDALFLSQVYFISKFCLSVSEIVGLRVPLLLCSVSAPHENCPSARCAAAANVVCRDVDVFGAKIILLNHKTCYNCAYYYYYFMYVYVYVCMY